MTANHAMMVQPEAVTGRIEGNPLRADIEEAVAMLGVDFILNVVVNGDHRVVGAVAGDVTRALRKGCEMVAARGIVQIPRRADIVVASAGGFPKDINLYQAQKGLDGGVIILVAQCPERYGNQTFKEWILGADSPMEVMERIQREFVLGGHKAAAIAAVQQRASIFMVSALPEAEVRKCKMVPFNNVKEAFEAAMTMLGEDSGVLVLPQAGSILPELLNMRSNLNQLF